MLLVISFGALIAMGTRSAARNEVARHRGTVACVMFFIILVIGVAGYIGIELVVGCHRGDSEYVDGEWRLWPLGNHCEFPATERLPAEQTEPGWGVSAAAIMIMLLILLWVADTAKLFRNLKNEGTQIRTSVD